MMFEIRRFPAYRGFAYSDYTICWLYNQCYTICCGV